LHTFAIARDGTLTEPNAPVIFPQNVVPANAHPQGIAVVQLGGHERERFDGFGIDLEDRDRDRGR
jgi:hypothetical protein